MDNSSGTPAGPPGNPPSDKPPGADPGTFTQQFEHQPVSARVPERVARGVLSTGVLVLDSPTEFVLDFMQGLTRPYQIVARVVVAPAVMEQIAAAVADNWAKFSQTFPKPAPLPTPPPGHRPTIAEIYENFKLPEEMLSGSYANSVMIGHSPTEFFFDFITGFYPHAAVSSRVMLAAPQVPRVSETLNLALQNYRKRYLPPPAAPPQANVG
jgi:hypothetical protein